MWLAPIQGIQKAVVIPTAFCLLLNTSNSIASGARPFSPPIPQANADAQAQCDRLASPPPLVDPAAVGAGNAMDKIDVTKAIPACQQAVRRSSDPRYIMLYGVTLRAAQRYAEAVQQSKLAATRGNAVAMINLGDLYSHGQGVPRNVAEGLEWYRKAADAGSAFGMRVLGDKYLEGDGVPQSDAEAASWYRKAADRGDGHSMVNLGDFYEHGRAAPQSFAEALAWYHKAVDRADGDADGDAMAHLGYLYVTGGGVPQSATEAATWYRKAADRGNANGMFNLGALYQSGQGVPKSFPDAAIWYQKAANQNYDKAEIMLGFLYQNGWGVKQPDFNIALALYMRASRSKRPEVASDAVKMANLLRNLMPNADANAENRGNSNTGKLIIAGLIIVAAMAASNGNANGSQTYQDVEQNQQDNSICAAKAFGLFDGDGYSAGVLRGRAMNAGCFP